MILYNTNDNKKPIIKQLQILFARLLLSKRSAVETLNLLDSFGWSKRQRVEQQDVHEFYSLLIDAIASEFGNSDNTEKLYSLIRGEAYGINNIIIRKS